MLSKVLFVNNVDCNAYCKMNSFRFDVDKFSISNIEVNTPKKLTLINIIKSLFKQHIVQIFCNGIKIKINMKPMLKKHMHSMVYNVDSKNIIFKVKYKINKENSRYFDIKIELIGKSDNDAFSRQSSITSNEITPMKYPKNYFPITQEQSTYIESRATRLSRSSATSCNENQTYPQTI